MKFDQAKLATVLAAAAAALAGCDERQCVDAKGKVVADSYCGQGAGAATSGVHPGFFFVPVSTRAPIGATAAVARGGFGGESGGGHGGGEGGGE